MSTPESEPPPFSCFLGLFVLFEISKDVDYVEDFSGEFFEGEGEVCHACCDFLFIDVLFVDYMVIV